LIVDCILVANAVLLSFLSSLYLGSFYRCDPDVTLIQSPSFKNKLTKSVYFISAKEINKMKHVAHIIETFQFMHLADTT